MDWDGEIFLGFCPASPYRRALSVILPADYRRPAAWDSKRQARTKKSAEMMRMQDAGRKRKLAARLNISILTHLSSVLLSKRRIP